MNSRSNVTWLKPRWELASVAQSMEEPVVRALEFCGKLGVGEFVVCAGSRNGALILSLLDECRSRPWEIHPFFEERSAAFFALGRIRASRRPVAVITTSGTAVAELLPAAIEAYYQALPLVLITADRPERFRGSGAPQAIEQEGVFGAYAATDDGTWQVDRPFHLNVPLEEPQPGSVRRPLRFETATPTPSFRPCEDEATKTLTGFLRREDSLLVVAGCLTDGEFPELTDFLVKLQAPILADATSGLHAEPRLAHWLVKSGDRLLKSWWPDRVLRIGGVPSFRFWRDLEDLHEITVCSVSDRPFSGLARPSELIVGDIEGLCAGAQVSPKPANDTWRSVDNEGAFLLEELLRRLPASEPAVVRGMLDRVGLDAALFVGSSLPIREAALMGVGRLPLRCAANRGANGIDGNLSTFLGWAWGHDYEAWGLFGDLTTLYDLTSPAILARMPNKAPVRIVVMNNQGGKIFRLLPHYHNLSADAMKVIENPHEFQFQHWAQAWGLDYHCYEGGDALPASLPERLVIELRADPVQTGAFWRAWRE